MSENSDDHTKDKYCEPIKSLTELEQFFNDPPEWINYINDLVLRSSDVVKYNGTGRCHYGPTEPIFEKRFNRNYVPKTLVCHDFKNGYLQDRFVNGCPNDENDYIFDKWFHIDIFVYFSHHLITIPPLGWINLAHNHGVKILGTFITEWDDGKAFWNGIIDDSLPPNDIEKNIIKLAESLVQLMFLIKLDGWLINIENSIAKPAYVLSFVKHLTHNAHKMRSGSIIIWYDSVTESGDLKWQNELNSKNRCYFDVCDGIFLNYNWTAESLRRSAAVAQHRHLDVYAGVDVFGRGCYGNGRFHTYLAVRETREANVSMAIFAPGWTHETLSPIDDSNCRMVAIERFLHRDNAFWRSLGSYLNTHPITQSFFTTFNTGVNARTFDLCKQDIVLHRIPHSKTPAQEEELNVEPLLRWPCDCIRLYHDHISRRAVVELVGGEGRVLRLLTCSIPIHSSVTPLTLVTVSERIPGDDNALLRVVITVEMDGNGCRRLLLCTEADPEVTGKGELAELRKDRSAKEVQCDKVYDMGKIINACRDLPSHCRFNAYKLDINNGKIVDISMEIMDGSKLLLRAFGVVSNDMFKTENLKTNSL